MIPLCIILGQAALSPGQQKLLEVPQGQGFHAVHSSKVGMEGLQADKEEDLLGSRTRETVTGLTAGPHPP